MVLRGSYFFRKLLAVERKLTNHSDQFVLMRYFGVLFAIRYDSKSNVLGRMVWAFYRSVLLLTFATNCYKMWWTLANWEYSTSSTSVLAMAWIAIVALVRVLIFDRPVQGRLVRFLNDRTFCGHEQHIVDDRLRLQQWNNRLLMIVVVSVLLETVWFLASRISLQPEYMLQYQGQILGGRAVQLVYTCTSCCWAIMYITVSAFVYIMLNVFHHELAILVQSFANAAHTFERYRPLLHTLPECPDTAREETFYAELQSQLEVCIKRHVELLENIYEFYSTLAPFCFVQYYGTFVLLAACCAIVTFNGLSWTLVVNFVFIGFLVLESFVVCRSIDTLNERHSSIGSTLYNLHWHSGLRHSVRFASHYTNVRQSMLIVMIRAQTPFRLRITGHGTFSMNRFAELINSSYSMFTILLHFRTQTGPK